MALTMRARVAIAQGEPEQAERDAHDALARAASLQAYGGISDILECLGALADDGSHREAARLSVRRGDPGTHGRGPLQDLRRSYQASVAALRDPWARTTLKAHGPRAQPCPPRKRSATPSVAAANANDPPAAGPRSPPPNATWSASSAKGWPTTTSPPGFSSHRAPCRPTSPTSTPSLA